MARLSIFGILSNVQMLLFTALKGACVGTDALGNKYYRGRPGRGSPQERRWVIYASGAEASQVPPEWHGWLHHQTDDPPAACCQRRQPWQKPPRANPTGTDEAVFPPGCAGHRAAAGGDYVAWQPPQ